MKRLAFALMTLTLPCALCMANDLPKEAKQMNNATTYTANDLASVSPALAQYFQSTLQGKVWKRTELSPRDRSIVTVSAVVARNQLAELPQQINQALDNGVKPGEISEIITHLAFYTGWGNAMGAVSVAKEIFTQRGVKTVDLPVAQGDRLPLNEASEAARAEMVESNFGKVAPGVVTFTTETLFHDLWLRPALAPRDRSLVTFSALVATGQVAQITPHLNRALDNGLAKEQAAEALTQLAFYAGWPYVFSAMPVVKEVFIKRGE